MNKERLIIEIIKVNRDIDYHTNVKYKEENLRKLSKEQLEDELDSLELELYNLEEENK